MGGGNAGTQDHAHTRRRDTSLHDNPIRTTSWNWRLALKGQMRLDTSYHSLQPAQSWDFPFSALQAGEQLSQGTRPLQNSALGGKG